MPEEIVMPEDTIHFFLDPTRWVAMHPEHESSPNAKSCESVRSLIVHVAATAITNKDALVRAARPRENNDLPPVVNLYRNGHLVVTCFCHAVDPEEAVDFILQGVSMFEADAVTVVTDIHFTHLTKHPETGLPWQLGDMQRLSESSNPQGDVMREAIYVAHHERSGESVEAFFQYQSQHSSWERPASNCHGQRPNRKKRSGKRTLRPGDMVWAGFALYTTTPSWVDGGSVGRVAEAVKQAFSARDEPAKDGQAPVPDFGEADAELRTRFEIAACQDLGRRHPGRWTMVLPVTEASVAALD